VSHYKAPNEWKLYPERWRYDQFEKSLSPTLPVDRQPASPCVLTVYTTHNVIYAVLLTAEYGSLSIDALNTTTWLHAVQQHIAPSPTPPPHSSTLATAPIKTPAYFQNAMYCTLPPSSSDLRPLPIFATVSPYVRPFHIHNYLQHRLSHILVLWRLATTVFNGVFCKKTIMTFWSLATLTLGRGQLTFKRLVPGLCLTISHNFTQTWLDIIPVISC